MPQGQVVAEFKQYDEAVNFVENLIKNDFPSGLIAIVGSDLRSVERVRGKLNYGRVAISGLTTGAWIGLIVGIVFGGASGAGDPTQVSSVQSVWSSALIGAGIGMLINVIRFSLAKRKRGFISQSSMVASKYQIQVPTNLAGHPALNSISGSGQSEA
jgi:hypothetical protein